jgi:hypothetical protein
LGLPIGGKSRQRFAAFETVVVIDHFGCGGNAAAADDGVGRSKPSDLSIVNKRQCNIP